MPRWWARSTTATSLVFLASWTAAASAAAASASVERMLAAISAYGPLPDGLTAARLEERCGEDGLCVAELLVEAGEGRFRLVETEAPDTDTIRWAETKPSVTNRQLLEGGLLYLAIGHFGRKVEAEIDDALSGEVTSIVLDLRDNQGGDFGRMLRVAGRFLGTALRTLHIERAGEGHTVVVPDGGPKGPSKDLTVLVGPRTASSGEILAALLRSQGRARILGERTAGKDYLLRVVAVDQNWRLLVPAEKVQVPGEILAGGLEPDGPLPAGIGP